MKADEARRIVEQFGMTDAVDAALAGAPALTDTQLIRVRAILRTVVAVAMVSS